MMEIAIGMNFRCRETFIRLFESHTAIQGQTRSGKSNLLYLMLAEIAGRDEVLVCGLDPTGILLGPFDTPRARPYLAIGADSATVETALGNLVEEMDRRIQFLRQSKIDKIEEYSWELPRLVVVLEEFPGVLARADIEDRKLSKAIRLHVQRLANEGLKVGISLVIVAQKFLAEFGTMVRTNCQNRLSFKVDSADSIRLLHQVEDAGELVADMRKWVPGRCYGELLEQEPQIFQCDYLPYDVFYRDVETAPAIKRGTREV